MKILLSSHLFYPCLGGLEEVSRILAEQFVQLGHEVKVVTQSPDPENHRFSYEVIRQPSSRQLIQLTRWCDLMFHNNISLRNFWPLLFISRPWIITHQTWVARVTGQLSWRDHLKRWLCRRATNISISQAIADRLPVASIVLGNPYRAELFRPAPGKVRQRDLIFLGRLVSDKGVDLLLEALARLREDKHFPRLTIVGEGPEREALQQQAFKAGLAEQLTFTGSQEGEKLLETLCDHKILVVPSRWNEPFGLVALEGIASGCVVVGSSGGGLKDAIGPCGLTFPNGDSQALAAALQRLLAEPELVKQCQQHAPGHLKRFHPTRLARQYLAIFSATLNEVHSALICLL